MSLGLSGDAEQIAFVEQCSKLKDASFCAEVSRAIAAGTLTSEQALCELGCSTKPVGPARAQCGAVCYSGSIGSSAELFKSPIGIAIAVLAGVFIISKLKRR